MNGKLPPGWRTTELLPDDARLKEHLGYVKRVSEELAAIPRIKREVPNTWQGKPIEELTQEEREEFHFSQQPESTKAALLAQKTRKPHEDIDHLLRPMPECVANPEAKSLDELTARRTLTIEEVLLEKDIRQKARNTLGQSELSSVSPELREKGIQAFTYSKPAQLTEEQLKKLTKLEEIASRPIESKPKKSWWRGLFNEEESSNGSSHSSWGELLGKKKP